MSIRPLFKRLYTTTKVPVDEHCLPLKPTWSIESLLHDKCKSDEQTLISDQQFKRLLSLARIKIKDKEEATRLKAEIHQLQRFTETIKDLSLHSDKDIAPLTHLWKEGKSQLLRDDNVIEKDAAEERGRALLKHAAKKSGYFYTVEQRERKERMGEE